MRSYWYLIVITLIVVSGSLPVASQSQTAPDEPSEVLRQLLAMPAPPPFPSPQPESLIERPPEFFSKDKVPADDASIEDLQMYWSRWAAIGGHLPSETVQRRLLDACANDREALPGYLALFAATEANAKKVKQLFDQGQAELPEDWSDEVRNWLLMNSRYFLSELTAKANKVKDVDKEGSVKAEDALVALAHIDWPSAEPLLKRLVISNQPRTSALACSLVYRHAVDDKDLANEETYRNRLKAIAGDRNSPARARETSIEALSTTEWYGRDDWYLSLFADESLIDPDDGTFSSSPLVTLATNDPDKWIPELAKLLESKNLTVRSAAASCIMGFNGAQNRIDAWKLLLPWVSDATWAKDTRNHRSRLIQRMGAIDLPESIPHLINVLENDAESELHRACAGEALARYKDPRAVPALKKALLAEKNQYHRQRLLRGLVASGGLSESEQVDALEAVAERMMTPESREDLTRYREQEDPLPLSVSIGIYLWRGQDVNESLLKAVVRRADDLKKSNPAVANSLFEIVHQWESSFVDWDMLNRIANGTADAKTVAKVLQRRSKIRETLPSDVQGLVSIDGLAQGVGAVLLEDVDLAVNLLGSGKHSTQAAVLLCARLTRLTLPASAVTPLLKSQNQLLAAAAERYLLAEDSKEAREALWALHPNEAFVTGWLERLEYLGPKIDEVEKIENKLRNEFGKDDSPGETFALLGVIGGAQMVLRVYPDKAVYYQANDSSRYNERTITNEELGTFREFIRTKEIAELGPQFGPCHHDCVTSEFLQLSKEKGRRVFNSGGFLGWAELTEAFTRLNRGENLKTHYNFEDQIKGLEVLYKDDKLIVKDVWQKGTDLRIMVRRQETQEEENELPPIVGDDDGDENDAAYSEILRKERAGEDERYSWRVLRNGRATELTTRPEGFSTIDEIRFPLTDEELRAYITERTGKFISEDTIVFANKNEGLWRQSAGQKPVRISSENGWYSDPIATPDGKWVVVGRREEYTGWGPPHFVVRFNLRTGRETPVKLPPADETTPVAYVTPLGKVLVRRAAFDGRYGAIKSTGPAHPEFYLLDPATGETRLATGEFEPLLHEGKRFLQSAGKLNEFWAAIYDKAKDQTRVGRYNLKDFTFQQVLTVPRIAFDSMSMWVDEAAAKLYIVYKGDLLRLPLRSTP